VLKDTYNLLKARDPKENTAMDTWSYIWKNISNRAYNADFDVYEYNPEKPDDISISTYVSIK
jgi:predicted transcriptional regulator YdeE